MKKNLLKLLIFSVLAFVISCKKSSQEEITPDPFGTNANTGLKTKCNLKSITDDKDAVKSTFEYDANKKLTKVTNIVDKTTISFTYNTKGKIDKMDFRTPVAGESYTINYTYDETGSRVMRTKATVQGYEFLNNAMVYEGEKLIRATCDFDIFGEKIQVLYRMEYTGDNLTRVYSRTNGDKEVVVFEGVKYDDKLNFYPNNYNMFALGFLGLKNSYFGYLSKNNPVSIKIYDEKNEANLIDMNYTYDKKGVVLKNNIITTNPKGVKQTRLEGYQFIDCK
ncbi:MAG: hypothetical protein ACK4NY_13360 [Spirosomataceae bacterium]